MTFQFFNSLDAFGEIGAKGTVVTVGTFDGIHLGHQEVLKRLNELAVESRLLPVVVTFDPHPRVVVTPNKFPQLLTTLDEKEHFLPRFHQGAVVVLKFTGALMNLSAEEFVRTILVDKLNVKKLIVGYDHAFGRDRSGGTSELRRLGKELGFGVSVSEPIVRDGAPVSSTRIRNALLECRLSEATEMLGHDYAIFGTVERGIGLGRKLGYPTANVNYGRNKLLPYPGVYSCRVIVEGDEHMGMMFIGHNHFNAAKETTVEANLFDFDRDIYDAEIIVYPTRFIREGRKFSSTGELTEQMALDKKQVLQIISKGETAWQ